ncbi:MAG: PucR family transcriptional regulator [Eubacteriaceae bacterium]
MNFNLHLMIDIFNGMNLHIIETETKVQLSLTSVTLFQENGFKPKTDTLIVCTMQDHLNHFTNSLNYSFIIIGSLESKEIKRLNQQAIILMEEITKESVYIKVLEWLQAFNSNNESIRQIVFESKSINALLKIKSIRIKNSIALFDTSYQLVEFIDVGTDVSESLVWRNVLENGAIDLRIYSHEEMQNINQTIQNRESFFVFKRDGMDHIILPIYSKRKFIGNISSVSFTGGFDSEEISWLLHIANLINNSLLLQTRDQSNVEIAPQILVQLINLQDYQQRHLNYFLSQYPWLKREYFRLYMCDLNSDLILTGEIFRKYISSLQLEFDKAMIFYYKNRIIILKSDKQNKQNDSEDKKLFQNLDLKVGISNPFNDVTLLNLAYKQAKIVMQYSEKRISAFNDNAFPILLDVIHSSELNDIFIYQPFLLLWEKGNATERDFLYSVYIYLTNERSLHKASNLLCLHRNSLKYRVQKIGEEIEVDLLSDSLSQSMIILMNITLHKLINNETVIAE